MTTTKLFDTIDALVSIFDTALMGVARVIDGPPQDWDQLPYPSMVLVGTQPGTEESGSSGSSDFDFRTVGGQTYYEDLEVPCTVEVWGGESNVKNQRDLVSSILSTLQTAVRHDCTLGGVVLFSRISSISGFTQNWFPTGTRCTLVFTVAAQAYLEAG